MSNYDNSIDYSDKTAIDEEFLTTLKCCELLGKAIANIEFIGDDGKPLKELNDLNRKVSRKLIRIANERDIIFKVLEKSRELFSVANIDKITDDLKLYPPYANPIPTVSFDKIHFTSDEYLLDTATRKIKNKNKYWF